MYIDCLKWSHFPCKYRNKLMEKNSKFCGKLLKTQGVFYWDWQTNMNFLKAEEGVSGVLRGPWQFWRTEGQGDSKIMFSQMFVWWLTLQNLRGLCLMKFPSEMPIFLELRKPTYFFFLFHFMLLYFFPVYEC